LNILLLPEAVVAVRVAVVVVQVALELVPDLLWLDCKVIRLRSVLEVLEAFR
jgi:hypothetical protein